MFFFLLFGIFIVGMIIYLIWFFNATHLCPNCAQPMEIRKKTSFSKRPRRYGLHIEWIRVCPHCGCEK